MRVITLPATNQTIRLGHYIRGVRTAIQNPAAEFKSGLTTWWPTKGSEIRRQFLASVHDRINQGVPCSQRGM